MKSVVLGNILLSGARLGGATSDGVLKVGRLDDRKIAGLSRKFSRCEGNLKGLGLGLLAGLVEGGSGNSCPKGASNDNAGLGKDVGDKEWRAFRERIAWMDGVSGRSIDEGKLEVAASKDEMISMSEG